MRHRPERGIELGPKLGSGAAPRPAQVQRELSERVDPDVLRLAHDRRSLSCNRKPSIRLAISSPCVSSAKWRRDREPDRRRSEEHTSELQSQSNLVCRLLLEKKKKHKQAFPYSLDLPLKDIPTP